MNDIKIVVIVTKGPVETVVIHFSQDKLHRHKRDGWSEVVYTQHLKANKQETALVDDVVWEDEHTNCNQPSISVHTSVLMENQYCLQGNWERSLQQDGNSMQKHLSTVQKKPVETAPGLVGSWSHVIRPLSVWTQCC